jgi:hypothetical protein
MDDGHVSEIKRGGASRNAKLAGLSVGLAGRTALLVGPLVVPGVTSCLTDH